MKLIAHVNGDSDLLDAWFEHYRLLGVTSFHLVVHGPRNENWRLFELLDDYPIVIEDEYEGEFHATEKLRRLNQVLEPFRGEWMLWVDSDEFVQLPFPDITETIRQMERMHTDVLIAPFVQRISVDGSVDTPDLIADPFVEFPLGSVDLYSRMGVDASIAKHPLFFWAPTTVLSDGGNHGLPYGSRGRPAPFVGVTHHFKWRRNVRDRIEARARSTHSFRHESAGFARYLESHDWRIPLEGSFRATESELRRRKLLGVADRRKHAFRWAVSRLPESVDDRLMGSLQRLTHRGSDDTA